MSIEVVPHLNFRGEARAALTFYQSVFGGHLMVQTYGEAAGMSDPGDASGQSTAADRDLVIFGLVAAPSGLRIMAFDAPASFPFDKGVNAFYVAAGFSAPEEAHAAWSKLTEGGTVRRDLGPSPWSPLYGMLQDKFGIVWIVSVAPPQQQHA